MRILTGWSVAAMWLSHVAVFPLQAQVSTSDSTRRINRTPLMELLDRAGRLNRMPADLVGYKAKLETEVAVLLRREDGTELVGSMEQVASTLRWTRTGYYDQHVVGYRAQQAGISFSMLSVTPTGWVQPTLYGSRFRLRSRTASDSTGRRRRATADGADTMPVVHPLAPDRDAWYRFTGGDTVVTLQLSDRSIPIVQIRVRPRDDLTRPVVLFDGEISLDASRGTLVRVRGNFVRAGKQPSRLSNLATAVAFVEYEQAEHFGKYWLPNRQRIELQAAAPVLGEGRAVVRIVSRILDIQVNDTTLDSTVLARADSARALSRRKLTFAPKDSLSRFTDWKLRQGALTEGMTANDFDDVGPDRWRVTGAPRFDVSAPRPTDVLHFNRIEGVFTGIGGKLSLRDLAPGVVARANAGYAWSEQTVRGRVAIERTMGATKMSLGAGRSLDVTSDFIQPSDSGPGVFSLLTATDPYDYVDRTSGGLTVSRIRGARSLLLRGGVALVQDRYRSASRGQGLWSHKTFNENHFLDEGNYVRSTAVAEWHPDVNDELVKPGLGARLLYERGDGELDWQRAEVRMIARREVGPLIVAARLDAGSVFGNRLPPQQLFELTPQRSLPGYEQQVFAGSRAALLRARVFWISPYLRQPVKIGQLYWPAIAPGLSVGVQGGIAEAPTQAALDAIDRLHSGTSALGLPISIARPSDGVRATVSAGLNFFAGSLFAGFARPVDIRAPWKFVLGGGF